MPNLQNLLRRRPPPPEVDPEIHARLKARLATLRGPEAATAAAETVVVEEQDAPQAIELGPTSPPIAFDDYDLDIESMDVSALFIVEAPAHSSTTEEPISIASEDRELVAVMWTPADESPGAALEPELEPAGALAETWTAREEPPLAEPVPMGVPGTADRERARKPRFQNPLKRRPPVHEVDAEIHDRLKGRLGRIRAPEAATADAESGAVEQQDVPQAIDLLPAEPAIAAEGRAPSSTTEEPMTSESGPGELVAMRTWIGPKEPPVGVSVAAAEPEPAAVEQESAAVALEPEAAPVAESPAREPARMPRLQNLMNGGRPVPADSEPAHAVAEAWFPEDEPPAAMDSGLAAAVDGHGRTRIGRATPSAYHWTSVIEGGGDSEWTLIAADDPATATPEPQPASAQASAKAMWTTASVLPADPTESVSQSASTLDPPPDATVAAPARSGFGGLKRLLRRGSIQAIADPTSPAATESPATPLDPEPPEAVEEMTWTAAPPSPTDAIESIHEPADLVAEPASAAATALSWASVPPWREQAREPTVQPTLPTDPVGSEPELATLPDIGPPPAAEPARSDLGHAEPLVRRGPGGVDARRSVSRQPRARAAAAKSLADPIDPVPQPAQTIATPTRTAEPESPADPIESAVQPALTLDPPPDAAVAEPANSELGGVKRLLRRGTIGVDSPSPSRRRRAARIAASELPTVAIDLLPEPDQAIADPTSPAAPFAALPPEPESAAARAPVMGTPARERAHKSKPAPVGRTLAREQTRKRTVQDLPKPRRSATASPKPAPTAISATRTAKEKPLAAGLDQEPARTAPEESPAAAAELEHTPVAAVDPEPSPATQEPEPAPEPAQPAQTADGEPAPAAQAAEQVRATLVRAKALLPGLQNLLKRRTPIPADAAPVTAAAIQPEPEAGARLEPEPAPDGTLPEPTDTGRGNANRRVRGNAREVMTEPSTAPRPITGPRPSPKPRRRASKAVVSCPYCAQPLASPPVVSGRCPRCRQRIVVRRLGDRAVYLTEAALPVFLAERRRAVHAPRWIRERDRWLELATSAGAPPERAARLTREPVSETVAASSRALYMATVEQAARLARRDRRWGEASRLRYDQAVVLDRIARSPRPVPAEIARLHQEGLAATLRGIGEIARSAELRAATCCDACRADDGRAVRIADELRSPSLPHESCPKGLCRCRWYLADRDRTIVSGLLRRQTRPPRQSGPAPRT